jgi:membrane protein YqaA with SNARE-associated domain
VPSEQPPASLSAPSRVGRRARFHLTLRRWADAGWSGSVVFGWGLLQGCIFPGLADLFFLPLAIARPSIAYRLALVASAGTIAGSILLYVLGAEALPWLQGPVATLLGVSPEKFEAARATLSRWGAWAIFASTMSPLSTKWTSIASGAVGVPFAAFLGALTAGRLARTFFLAYVVRHGGAQAVERWVHR